ncbi:MAG: hypothetical protein GXP42_12800 [Chloroflexi bacterium]|nr:hypothetical protein [Chloroflexota bacterium]
MSKSRPTMRGRGEEILGRGVDALFSPPAEETAQPAESVSEVDEDLASMLESEARSATEGEAEAPVSEPSPIGAPEPSPPTPLAGGGVLIPSEEMLESVDKPLQPKARSADDRRIDVPPRFEEAQPTRPRVETGLEQPGPAAPTHTEATAAPSGGERRGQPAPPTDESSLPSRPRVAFAGPLADVGLTEEERTGPEAVRPPSPFAPRPTPTIEKPLPHQLSEEEAQKLRERIEDLNAQIDKLYRDVPKNVSNRPDLASQIMGLLRQARTILLERPQDFVEAEYVVQQAQAIYNRIENSEKWGDKYGWRIFYYEIFFLAFLLISFLGLLAFGNEFSDYLAGKVGQDAASPGLLSAVGLWATIAWGGIGGVMGALYTLWMHVSERQDFERQHTMWYIVQPILGMILGGVVFLILYTGLLSLQGGAQAAASLTQTVQLLPALLGFIAGFRPQFLFSLLTKIIKIINPTEE